MSRVQDIITRYYERYPEPGQGENQASYDRVAVDLRRFLAVTDRIMRVHGIAEETRVAVARDVVYGVAGDPDEQRRRDAEPSPRVSTEPWTPPVRGTGWTGQFAPVRPRSSTG